MKLIVISESRFKQRVIAAWQSNPDNPIQGIMDEFGCDQTRALHLAASITGGTYGEGDIDNRFMHRLRAPQSILKLLRYFKVDPTIVRKLMRLHKDRRPDNDPRLGDNHSYKQLQQGYRLVSQIEVPDEEIDRIHADGFDILLVPWNRKVANGSYHQKTPNGDIKYSAGIYYVFRPQDSDVAHALHSAAQSSTGNNRILEDLLNGLAYGFKMPSVYNFVRNNNEDFVDAICGHIDNWEEWSNPSKA